MKDIIDRLASYNIFNYLLTGVVFGVHFRYFFEFNLITDSMVINVFLFYFIGMIVSLVGSLIIEPILKKSGVLNIVDHQRYVAASKKDPKIEQLSGVNNIYRSLLSLVILLLLIELYVVTGLGTRFGLAIAVVAILAILTISYRKQTNFISERVAACEDAEMQGRIV